MWDISLGVQGGKYALMKASIQRPPCEGLIPIHVNLDSQTTTHGSLPVPLLCEGARNGFTSRKSEDAVTKCSVGGKTVQPARAVCGGGGGGAGS